MLISLHPLYFQERQLLPYQNSACFLGNFIYILFKIFFAMASLEHLQDILAYEGKCGGSGLGRAVFNPPGSTLGRFRAFNLQAPCCCVGKLH